VEIKANNLSKYTTIGAEDDIPLISWTVNNNCQYRCKYCYVDLKRDVSSHLESTSKIILKSLDKMSGEFNVELLGGEPTMHPNYINIVNKLIKMTNVKQLTITSNIKKNLCFWKDHPKHNKIRIFASQHPEYKDKDFKTKMIYINSNFELEGLLMLHEDIKYLDNTKSMADFMIDYKIKFEPTMIFDQDKCMIKYEDKVLSLFNEYKQSFGGIEYIDNNGNSTIMSVDKIYQGNLHLLKGWNCSTKVYTIDMDGNISRPCKPGSKQHIMLFKNFDNKDIKCVSDIGCMCDEWLRWKKWS
jgi:organic radical activating enzyme